MVKAADFGPTHPARMMKPRRGRRFGLALLLLIGVAVSAIEWSVAPAVTQAAGAEMSARGGLAAYEFGRTGRGAGC